MKSLTFAPQPDWTGAPDVPAMKLREAQSVKGHLFKALGILEATGLINSTAAQLIDEAIETLVDDVRLSDRGRLMPTNQRKRKLESNSRWYWQQREANGG